MGREELIDILEEMNTFNHKCFQARRGVQTYRNRIHGKINKLLRKHYGPKAILTEEEYRYLIFM
jgi:hypothetical protein